MQHQPELQRFSLLVQAFVDIAGERGDVRLSGSASPPPMGFTARLEPEPGGDRVELSLWLDGARLLTSRGQREYGPGTSQRFLHLDLSRGYRWESLIFPDAEHLARTLLVRMEDELSPRDGRPGWVRVS